MIIIPRFTSQQLLFAELSTGQRLDVLQGLTQSIEHGLLKEWPVLPPEGFPKHQHLTCVISSEGNRAPMMLVCSSWDDVCIVQDSSVVIHSDLNWYAMRDWNSL